LNIRLELNQPQLLVEDWAGLALVAWQQSDQLVASKYADKLIAAWTENPIFDGAEHPMRVFHFTWQVVRGLELALANDVLIAAARVIQIYLDHQPDLAAQAMYLEQPHHQALWGAWQYHLAEK